MINKLKDVIEKYLVNDHEIQIEIKDIEKEEIILKDMHSDGLKKRAIECINKRDYVESEIIIRDIIDGKEAYKKEMKNICELKIYVLEKIEHELQEELNKLISKQEYTKVSELASEMSIIESLKSIIKKEKGEYTC